MGLQLPGRCCVWAGRVMGWAPRPPAAERALQRTGGSVGAAACPWPAGRRHAWRAHGACRLRGTARAALCRGRHAGSAPAEHSQHRVAAVARGASAADAPVTLPHRAAPPGLADVGPLTRRPRRWPEAVTAAVGRPVSAAPARWQQQRWWLTAAPGCPGLAPACQPPDGRQRPAGFLTPVWYACLRSLQRTGQCSG